jgi:hypothetical protein
MFGRGGLEEQGSGVDGTTADGNDIAKVGGEFRWGADGAVVLNYYAGDGGASCSCNNFSYFCFR